MDQLPPVVLLVYANERMDPDRHLRNLSLEIGRIRDALQVAEHAGLCQVLIEANATADRIVSVFQDPRYRNRIAIFHYAGHAEGDRLLTEAESGAVAPGRGGAHAAGLAAFLGAQRGLELVFLNGCSTVPQVQGLLDAHCPAVVATSRAIDDQVAMELAAQFYRGLAGGAGLGSAFDAAAAATRTRHGDAPRGLYWGGAVEAPGIADDWPWSLAIKPGAESVLDWTLREAADDPLFGLPPLPDDIALPQEGPFRHLSWFERQHARVFFGRGHEIRRLYDLVTDPDGAPIILVYGQSGVGKSSLLDAGLLPRLESDYSVRYRRRDRDLGLFGTLMSALDPDTARLDEAWVRSETSAGRPLLVVLDQVEEYDTQPLAGQTDELKGFMTALGGLFGPCAERPRGRLLLGFRKEWLSEVQQRLSEQGLGWESLFLEGLSREGILEAVIGPTRGRLQRKYGLAIEAPDHLAGEIADDLLADPGSALAPTLQILLTKLWHEAKRQNDAHPRFTHDLYLALKRNGILLGDFLDQQLAALEQWQPKAVQSGLALDLLTFHTTSRGTAEQRTEAELLETYAHLHETVLPLVQRCREDTLLADIPSTAAAPVKGARLTHDTLAPLVRERFERSDRPGQRAWRILKNRGVEWRDGRSGALLDDADLVVVEAARDSMRRWEPDEERLVAASRRDADERQAQAERTARELLEAQASAAARRVEAEHHASLALARQLAIQATVEAERYPIRALLLAAEAVKRSLEANGSRPPGPEGALRRQLEVTGGTPLSMRGLSLGFDPLGRWIAIGELDGTLCLWDLEHPGSEPWSLYGHQDRIWTLAFHYQGRWLATGSTDHTTCVWNLQQPGASPRVLRGHTNCVSALAFDRQGRWLATGSWDGTARLWALRCSGGEPRVVGGSGGRIETLSFDVSGRWLVTTSDDKRHRLWQLDDPTAAPWTLLDVGNNTELLALDPRGRWAISAGAGNSPLLWDLHNPRTDPTRLTGHAGKSSALAIDPEGRWLAVGSWDNHLRIWDLEHPEAAPADLVGHPGAILALAFDPDGCWLASGDTDGVVCLWNMRDSPPAPRRMRGHQGWVTHLAFDAQQGWLVTGSDDKTVRLWEIDHPDHEPLVLRGHDTGIAELEIAPNGLWLATRGAPDDYSVRLWPLQDCETEPRILGGHADGIRPGLLALDGQGRWLAAGAGSGTARLWDMQRPGAAPRVLTGHTGGVAALALDQQGQWLATGDNAGGIALWQLGEPASEPKRLMGHTDLISSLKFDPQGRWLLSSSWDGSIRRWGLMDDSPPSVLYAATAKVQSLVMDPDGRWVAARTDDDTVQLWETDRLDAPPSLIKGDGSPINAVALDPRGRWLATGGLDGTVRLWPLTDLGTPSYCFQASDYIIESVVFDPQGRWLAASDTDGATTLWDIQEVPAQRDTLPGHEGIVWALNFDPLGRWLATGAQDKTIRLLTLCDPQSESLELSGHTGEVRALSFDPQGRWLASGSTDGAIRIWQLDVQPLLDRACQTAGRNLTAEEWRQYVGAAIPYQVTCPRYPGAAPVAADGGADSTDHSTARSASSPASETK